MKLIYVYIFSGSLSGVHLPVDSLIASPTQLLEKSFSNFQNENEEDSNSGCRRTFELIEYVSTPHIPTNIFEEQNAPSVCKTTTTKTKNLSTNPSIVIDSYEPYL